MRKLERHFQILLVAGVSLVLFSSAVALMRPALREKSTTPSVWATQLENTIRQVDAATPGNLGVYVKKLSTGEEMDYRADRDWYFASTVKVPVAIAILGLVEEGRLSLSTLLTLKSSDAVDGSGEVQFKRPGTKVSVAYLLEKMLTQSDSTATDLLVRLMGESEFNHRIRSKMGIQGFHPFTTILQVRKDAFGQVHPKARSLTNRDFINLKRHRSSAQKYRALVRQMRVPVSQLRARSIDEAFERYYQSGLNSGTLRAYGVLLEKLLRGELLSPEHTKLVLRHMFAMTTGERRIKAGLPRTAHFAQKTGTQHERICNMGIVYGLGPNKENLIVTACLEKFRNFNAAEATLKKVGQALAQLERRPAG